MNLQIEGFFFFFKCAAKFGGKRFRGIFLGRRNWGGWSISWVEVSSEKIGVKLSKVFLLRIQRSEDISFQQIIKHGEWLSLGGGMWPFLASIKIRIGGVSRTLLLSSINYKFWNVRKKQWNDQEWESKHSTFTLSFFLLFFLV